jgi:hypothetical protein
LLAIEQTLTAFFSFLFNHNFSTTAFQPQLFNRNFSTAAFQPQLFNHNFSTTTFQPQLSSHNFPTTTFQLQLSKLNISTTGPPEDLRQERRHLPHRRGADGGRAHRQDVGSRALRLARGPGHGHVQGSILRSSISAEKFSDKMLYLNFGHSFINSRKICI